MTQHEYKEHFMAVTVTIGHISKSPSRKSYTVSPHPRPPTASGVGSTDKAVDERLRGCVNADLLLPERGQLSSGVLGVLREGGREREIPKDQVPYPIWSRNAYFSL